MNVNVIQGSNNQIFVHRHRPATRGRAASLATPIQQYRNTDATALWSANPSQDGAGTITLVSPGGATTDLIATRRCSRDNSAPTCRCATPSCRRRRPSSTNSPTRCPRRCLIRRRTGPQSPPVRNPGLASMSARCCQATVFSSPIRTPASPARDHRRVAGGRWHVAGTRSIVKPGQPGYRDQLFRRHGLGRDAAQRRARGEPAIFQSVRHGLASAQQWQRQRCQFTIGYLDPDLAHQRQRAAATVHGWERRPTDHRRHHGERLADHRPRRNH